MERGSISKCPARGSQWFLIHGGLVNCHLWDGQFPKFAQYFQTVRYDLRGFGQSEFPSVPYSHIEDLRALLQFLGISACGSMFISACGSMSIGLSLGGSIATNFTLAYPELVESLVLAGAGLDG
jgi:pimeloyl-ACP methyl ester carboxylesterase